MSVEAIIALCSFAVFFTANVVGAVAWIDKRFREMKKDFDDKHSQNIESVSAIRELVIRHEVMLNGEFVNVYHPFKSPRSTDRH